jgi:excisionase family DNA binding protein
VPFSKDEGKVPFSDGPRPRCNMSENPLLTVTEVADRLRLSPNKVYELLHSHQIPHIRLGRKFRIPAQALERWIETAVQIEETNGDVIRLSHRLVG